MARSGIITEPPTLEEVEDDFRMALGRAFQVAFEARTYQASSFTAEERERLRTLEQFAATAMHHAFTTRS